MQQAATALRWPGSRTRIRRAGRKTGIFKMGAVKNIVCQALCGATQVSRLELKTLKALIFHFLSIISKLYFHCTSCSSWLWALVPWSLHFFLPTGFSFFPNEIYILWVPAVMDMQCIKGCKCKPGKYCRSIERAFPKGHKDFEECSIRKGDYSRQNKQVTWLSINKQFSLVQKSINKCR